jgi:hypothetical protein
VFRLGTTSALSILGGCYFNKRSRVVDLQSSTKKTTRPLLDEIVTMQGWQANLEEQVIPHQLLIRRFVRCDGTCTVLGIDGSQYLYTSKWTT